MYAIMKLEHEAPIYDNFGFGPSFKSHIKSVVQINQSSNMKSSVVQTACNEWNKKWDDTHLVLYSWGIGYLVKYQFSELQGLKGREN